MYSNQLCKLKVAVRLAAKAPRVPNISRSKLRCLSASGRVIDPVIKGGDQVPDVGDVTPQQEKRIQKRYQQMREDHFRQREEYPQNSHGDSKVGSDEARRKRLLYRSKQRGLLEVDLLMGRWASMNIDQLSVEELDQYEALLNRETIDIFYYITKKQPVPEELQTPVLAKIQDFCDNSPLGKASLETFAINKPQ